MGGVISQIFILSQLNRASSSERAAMATGDLQTIQAGELNAVTMTYITIGFTLLLLWLVIFFTKMPRASDAGSKVDRSGLDTWQSWFWPIHPYSQITTIPVASVRYVIKVC